MAIVLDGTTGVTTPAIDAAAGNADLTTLSVAGNEISAVNSLGFRNRIINGAMVIDQRNNGAAVTNSGNFVVDRWSDVKSGSGQYTAQQSTTAPTGFTNSFQHTITTAVTPAAGDVYQIVQVIEGFNTADLSFGTAQAQTVTLSFWVRASIAGTYSVSLSNGTGTGRRFYVATYSVSAANTWEYETITIPGDTSGAWAKNNSAGISVHFDLGSGSNHNATANTWSTGSGAAEGRRTSGSVSLISTNGATFYITGVQLEAGTVATPFERRDYGRELMMCQRYFYKTTGGSNTRHAISGNGSLPQSFPTVFFKVTMRAVPTVSVSSVSHFNIEALNGAGSVVTTSISWNAGDTDSATLNVTSAGSGGAGCNLLGTNPSAVLGYSAEL